MQLKTDCRGLTLLRTLCDPVGRNNPNLQKTRRLKENRNIIPAKLKLGLIHLMDPQSLRSSSACWTLVGAVVSSTGFFFQTNEVESVESLK